VSAPYVALGDSYAAGVGGGPRVDECWRAVDGYPVTVARALGLDVAYNACIGATIEHVRDEQLADLGPDTRLVTLTVGGNDVDFVPVVVKAAEPWWLGDSDEVIDAALKALRDVLPGRVSALFEDVRAAAPSARVVVTDYPRLFNGTDCNAATFFSEHEMERLNAAADELSDTLRRAAGDTGCEFVEVLPSFVGHGVCDATEWLNGVAWPLEGSYHPNHLGHARYARAVVAGLSEAAERPGELVPDTSRAEAEPAVVRRPMPPGPAPTFSLPDLMSGRARTMAAAHGIPEEELERLAAEVAKHDLHPRA
jgi:lysophospholipase L1-like esterase